MALKSLFESMKREGYIVKGLDQYLYGLNASNGSNRAIDVNSPSSAGSCMRARYYKRLGFPSDGGAIDPRTRRIFDNGTKTHERLQEYLKDQGMLLMDEVPVYNEAYNIQGHTDGLLKLSPTEKGILEIKSINSHGFSSLREAKEDHKKQGLVYIYCVEERRKKLKVSYPTKQAFTNSIEERREKYESLYQHLKDGSKYSREDKIKFQSSRHEHMDSILFETNVPISKAVFLYENKDTQDLKEFTISMAEPVSKRLISEVLNDYETLNRHIAQKELPERCCKNKSDSACRWCDYQTICWG